MLKTSNKILHNSNGSPFSLPKTPFYEKALEKVKALLHKNHSTLEEFITELQLYPKWFYDEYILSSQVSPLTSRLLAGNRKADDLYFDEIKSLLPQLLQEAKIWRTTYFLLLSTRLEQEEILSVREIELDFLEARLEKLGLRSSSGKEALLPYSGDPQNLVAYTKFLLDYNKKLALFIKLEGANFEVEKNYKVLIQQIWKFFPTDGNSPYDEFVRNSGLDRRWFQEAKRKCNFQVMSELVQSRRERIHRMTQKLKSTQEVFE